MAWDSPNARSSPRARVPGWRRRRSPSSKRRPMRPSLRRRDSRRWNAGPMATRSSSSCERILRSPHGAKRNAGTALPAERPLPDFASLHPGYGAKTSIHADAGRLDHLTPAINLLREILGEIFRAAALGRHDLQAELLQALALALIVQHVAHHLVELAHDRLGCSLGKEEGVPHAGFDA